jgi:ATP-dependent RNA helicase DDX60
LTWWLEQLSLLKKKDVPDQIKHLTSVISGNPRSREKWTGIELRLYRLHLELMSWVAESKPDSSVVHDRYSVSILRMIKDISDKKSCITATVSSTLSSVLRALGFEDYVGSLATPTETEDQALNFSFIKLFRSKDQIPKYDWMKIREHPAEWQLRVFGEFLDRSMDSAPDSRVSFEPDAWQRRVLDCIDRRKSILVVGSSFSI